MSRVFLVQLSPRRASDGVVQVQYWSHNSRTTCRFLGQDWLPGIVSLPDTELDLGFDGAKFGQGATPQVGQLRIAIGRSDAWAGLVWKGAAGVLRSAAWPAGLADPADGAFAIDLSFRVESIAIDDGVATLTLIDLGAELRRPLITRKFGATGNALLDGAGTVDRRGQVVPTGWGRLRSVPGILVDRVNNIWLLLDRPSSSVQGFFDGGAAFTLGVARASLAALQATVPAQGVVDYCLNAAGLTLARPWTDPTYPFTADLTADGNQTAAGIAQSVIAGRSVLGFVSGTIAAFDALYPAVCGLYVDDERTIATALDELIVRLGGFWRLTGPGEILLGRLAPASPVQTFGRTQVASIARQSIVMPTRRRSVGYARNNRVHSEGEIASILLANDIFFADGTPIEAPTGMFEDWSRHGTLAALQRAWLVDNPAALGLGQDGNMTGGWTLQVTGECALIGKHRIPYAYEDLYRVKARAFVSAVGSGGNTHFVGIAAYDATGASLVPADSGSLHYFAGANVPASPGFYEWEGFFRGRAAIGTGANVGVFAPNPSSPNPVRNGAVTVAPVFLANYNGTGGQIRIDYIEIEKVTDFEEAAALGLNSDGTVRPNKVVAQSLSANVLNEIVSASQSGVTATAAGALLLVLPALDARPSQGGYVHFILNCNLRLPTETSGGSQLYGWLQRSPAGAGSWTHLHSWLMGKLRQAFYQRWENPGYVNAPVTSLILNTSSTAQYIDVPPSDGAWDYRWVVSTAPAPFESVPADLQPAVADNAYGMALSVKVGS